MKKILIILVMLFWCNVSSAELSPATQKKLIQDGTIKKGMTLNEFEEAVSTNWERAFHGDTLFGMKKSGHNVLCSTSGGSHVYWYQRIGYCFTRDDTDWNDSKLIQIWEDPLAMIDHWLSKATHKKNRKKLMKL